ncbi:MAG: hypothetical protein Q7T82_04955 [Armatimonadota bacterium]|nr:hypothetical protein [Armatimonadota bacterium]
MDGSGKIAGAFGAFGGNRPQKDKNERLPNKMPKLNVNEIPEASEITQRAYARPMILHVAGSSETQPGRHNGIQDSLTAPFRGLGKHLPH